MLPRQELYHLSHAPQSLFCFFSYFSGPGATSNQDPPISTSRVAGITNAATLPGHNTLLISPDPDFLSPKAHRHLTDFQF
jgi:hypothetical protein